MKAKIMGFTLIELIMVIVILGIIASVTLPKFVNFKARAIESNEDAVIGALKTAIQTIHLSYVVQGFPESWPAPVLPTTIFDLMAQAPPISYQAPIGDWTFTISDGQTWRYYYGSAYYIFCPHYYGAPGSAGKGRYYLYQHSTYFGYTIQQGDISLWSGKGH